MHPSLLLTEALLAPRSVAIIGASADANKHAPLAQLHLRHHGFRHGRTRQTNVIVLVLGRCVTAVVAFRLGWSDLGATRASSHEADGAVALDGLFIVNKS